MTIPGFIAIWISGVLGAVAISCLSDREWVDVAFYGALCLFAAVCGVVLETIPGLVEYLEAR